MNQLCVALVSSSALALYAGCGPAGRSNSGTPNGPDAAPSNGSGAGTGSNSGSGSGPEGFLVYAHSDHVLYSIDLGPNTLVTVGAFNAPQVTVGTSMHEDSITDLAVAPDGTIYVISETAIYTANATDGHVTRVGSLSSCGAKAVALTTTPDGKLWTGDYMGAICEIDLTHTPPVVKAPVMMGSGIALTGDLVAVDNGTVFGTAYRLSDSANTGTQMNNLLVKIDLATGAVTTVGPSGFPKLFGTAYQQGMVFGFSHDGTGHVVAIDPNTGVGTIFGTFQDPTTHKGISFAGAGVNSLIIE
jgi:hypothetical protein